MNWLSSHFWLLFEGVGGALLVAILIYYLQWRDSRDARDAERDTPTGGTATVVRDSQNSPVASGSGIIQNVINFPAQPSSSPAPASAPEPVVTHQPKPIPNIQMTGTGVVTALVRDWVWKENESGTDQAVFIQFTNEARREGRNVGVPVKALLIYKNDGTEVQRIVGSWFYEAREYIDFQVDESHKLMVGIRYNQQLCVIGRRRVIEQGFPTVKPEVHDLPEFQTVSVRLTNANNGDFLYEGEFLVTIDPLKIVPYYIARGDIKLR